MGVIENFLREYEREFDFWDASAQVARGLLEAELASSGLRAIVTSRAKSVDRLAEKLRTRNTKERYRSVRAIRENIADLAGVRVALYFPGQMDEAERIIRDVLDVQLDKRFPSVGNRVDGRRFSGYGARHFRVFIPTPRLSQGQERFASSPIEVQVASVLMHAWSEVEHDLVYKPLEGTLSRSEYALLDQLNGLVLAGEIALEQLQKAGDERVAAAATPFRSHYELAEYLRTRLSMLGTTLSDATLGRVDALFEYLAEQGNATAASVEPYLDLLEKDFERRPVSAQLADLMLSGDESRYRAYLKAMATSRHPSRARIAARNAHDDSDVTLALGEFVAAWVLLETLLKSLAQTEDARLPPLPVLFRRLRTQGLISPEELEELDAMRDLRNRVFHGRVGEIPPARLRQDAGWLRALTVKIENTARSA